MLKDGATSLRVLASVIVGAVFLFAASSKTLDNMQLGRVVVYFLPISVQYEWIWRLVVSAVIAWEFLLGLLLVSRACPNRTWALGSATLLAFTGVLVYLFMAGGGPRCGCMGALSARLSPQMEALMGAVRNAGLLAVLWVSRTPPETVRQPRDFTYQRSSGQRAYTLIELLVSIAVVALLVALVLPGLRGARESSLDAKSASLSRQIVAATSMYVAHNRDEFPFVATPRDPLGPISIGGTHVRNRDGYFWESSRYWVSLLWPNYLDVPRPELEYPEADQIRKSWRLPDPVVLSRFYGTHAMHAMPDYWREGPVPSEFSALRGTTLTALNYPSRKVLALDIARGAMSAGDGSPLQLIHVGMGDGGARRVPVGDFPQARIVNRPFGALPLPGLSTRDGVAGWDY